MVFRIFFFFSVVFGLQNLTAQHNCLNFSLSNNNISQSSPDLNLFIRLFILSSLRHLGRPSGLFLSGAFSNTVLSSNPPYTKRVLSIRIVSR